MIFQHYSYIHVCNSDNTINWLKQPKFFYSAVYPDSIYNVMAGSDIAHHTYLYHALIWLCKESTTIVFPNVGKHVSIQCRDTCLSIESPHIYIYIQIEAVLLPGPHTRGSEGSIRQYCDAITLTDVFSIHGCIIIVMWLMKLPEPLPCFFLHCKYDSLCNPYTKYTHILIYDKQYQ